jgi:hypothetical protein
MVGGWVGKEEWSDVKKKSWAWEGEAEIEREWLGIHTVLGLFSWHFWRFCI